MQLTPAVSLYNTRIDFCQVAIGAQVKTAERQLCECPLMDPLSEKRPSMKNACCLSFTDHYFWCGSAHTHCNANHTMLNSMGSSSSAMPVDINAAVSLGTIIFTPCSYG